MTCETCKAPVGEGRIWVAPGRVVCSMFCGDRLPVGLSGEGEELTKDVPAFDWERAVAVMDGRVK